MMILLSKEKLRSIKMFLRKMVRIGVISSVTQQYSVLLYGLSSVSFFLFNWLAIVIFLNCAVIEAEFEMRIWIWHGCQYSSFYIILFLLASVMLLLHRYLSNKQTTSLWIFDLAEWHTLHHYSLFSFSLFHNAIVADIPVILEMLWNLEKSCFQLAVFDFDNLFVLIKVFDLLPHCIDGLSTFCSWESIPFSYRKRNSSQKKRRVWFACKGAWSSQGKWRATEQWHRRWC